MLGENPTTEERKSAPYLIFSSEGGREGVGQRAALMCRHIDCGKGIERGGEKRAGAVRGEGLCKRLERLVVNGGKKKPQPMLLF